ncbi:MAG: glutathione S-transferase family protein [Alphaproteobacteria bacterium]|nr:glutathione S-transferase family protein [Alphaproteobacteria bacterium]
MSWIDQKLTLYGRLESGSVAVEALMVEMGLDFDLVEVPKVEELHPKSGTKVPDWFLNINPMGGIPTIVFGDHRLDQPVPAAQVLTESSAMMLALGDTARAKSAGLFVPGPEDQARLSYLRWMSFFAASVYPNDLMYFYSDRWTNNSTANAEIKARAKIRQIQQMTLVQNYLGDRPFLLGAQISPLDFYAAMFCSWSWAWIEGGDFPKIHRYCETIFNRPKSKAIWEKHAG